MFRKVLSVFICLFVLLSNVSYAKPEESVPTLYLTCTDIDSEHFVLSVSVLCNEQMSVFVVPIAYNPNNVRACIYNSETGSYTDFDKKVFTSEDFTNGTSAIVPGEMLTVPGKWTGQALFNDSYPAIDNTIGLVKNTFLSFYALPVTATQEAFKIYFKRLNGESPEIRIATHTNADDFDMTAPNGAGFYYGGGEIEHIEVFTGDGYFTEDPGSNDENDPPFNFADHIKENVPEEDNVTVIPPSQGSSGSSGGTGSSGGSASSGNDRKEEDVSGEKVPSDDTSAISYPDIDDVPWAQEAILYLSERGVISGYDDGTFRPNNNITREEFTKLFTTAKGVEILDKESVFEDVENGAWHRKFIMTAYENGYVDGFSDTIFGVGEKIIRQDMAVMLYRSYFDDSEEVKPAEFADFDKVDDYAKAAVSMLSSKGIINGKGDNCFDPKGFATRAEAAKVIYLCVTMQGN